jgi:hypothetical protein
MSLFLWCFASSLILSSEGSIYRGISRLSTSYKILSNILLSRLSPYRDEIIGDHQCGFRRNRSTTDQSVCIRQIQGKKMGIQRDSITAIRILQKSLRFSKEGSIVQYSHRVSGTHVNC